MRVSPFTVAEESLGASSAMRGLGGMERTAAPKGPNMFDGGPASKVQVNTQPFNNARLMQQNIQQNTTAAIPQAASEAIQQAARCNWLTTTKSTKQTSCLKQRKSEILSVMNAPATLAMGNMSPPEMAKVPSRHCYR